MRALFPAAVLTTLLAANACVIEIKELVAVGAGGASSGQAGGAGVGGSGGSSASGGNAACPDDMVHAQHEMFPDISFCIDRTEVTRTDYVAFLLAVSSDVGQTQQPAECAFNTELTHFGSGTACPDFTTSEDLPVNCVDWCDAYAYCAHVGKRLCGSLDGGAPLAIDAPVTGDEWQFACSAGFQQAYPYGDEGELCACYLPEEWDTLMACDYMSIVTYNHKKAVMSHPGCEGGFPGIFDMQGNASEWTARCEPGNGDGEENCVVRGGSTWGMNGSSWFRCDNLQQQNKRNDVSLDPGIRCCRDADAG